MPTEHIDDPSTETRDHTPHDDETEDGAGTELDSIAIMGLIRRFMEENQFINESDWDDTMISHLEEIMDTVCFLDYEEIMQADEHATWAGLVLDGNISILISGKRVATLSHGCFVGEMSLFTGLKRNADVLSASADTVIGVIRFDVLDNLWSERPRLVVALMTAMGSAAVYKSGDNGARQAKAESERIMSNLLNTGRDKEFDTSRLSVLSDTSDTTMDNRKNSFDADELLTERESVAPITTRSSRPSSPISPSMSRSLDSTRSRSPSFKKSGKKSVQGKLQKAVRVLNSTRALTTHRLAPEEAAKQEVIYRSKFVELRRSEKRHKKARQSAHAKASRQARKRKRDRLTFQKREREFVQKEEALREKLLEAEEKNAILEGNKQEPKKRDENMIMRQLRAQLAAQLKREEKLRMKLKTVNMQFDDHRRKHRAAIKKEKDKVARQAKELKNLRSRKITLEQIVADYERHGDHDTLIERVKVLSVKNEECMRESQEMKIELETVRSKHKKEIAACNEKVMWMRGFVRRVLRRGKHWRTCLYTYWEWASEMLDYTEEKLSEAKEEVRQFESILKIEVKKNRERQIMMEQYVEQAQAETSAVQSSLESCHDRLSTMLQRKCELEAALSEMKRKASCRKALLLAWWVAWMILGSRRKFERAKVAKHNKSRELTLKALRSRLAVFKSDSEEKLCKQRLNMQNEISELKKKFKEAKQETEKIVILRHDEEQKTESTLSGLKEVEMNLQKRILTAEREKSHAEYKLEHTLRELKMRMSEQEACEDQLGWCLQRLRVSECRRLELESLFGTVAQPSALVADEVSRIREEHRARRVGKRRAEAESILYSAATGGSQILGFSSDISLASDNDGSGSSQIFGIPSVESKTIEESTLDDSSLWSSSSSRSAAKRAQRIRLKTRPNTSPGLRGSSKQLLSPLQPHSQNPNLKRAKSASNVRSGRFGKQNQMHQSVQGHWMSPYVRKRLETVQNAKLGSHSKMLKKGIVRRQQPRSAPRSRSSARSTMFNQGSKLGKEGLISSLERAKMKKSLLKWGDDDSILLKPYPIERFEGRLLESQSMVQHSSGVLDYRDMEFKIAGEKKCAVDEESEKFGE